MSGTSLIAAPKRRAPSRRQSEVDQPRALLEFHSPTAAVIAEPIRPAARGIPWSIFAMVVLCLIAMSTVPISKEVTATGAVVSLSPNDVVQPLETAIVRSIDVQVGETVRKGQVLARLDPTFASADVTSLTEQVDSLQAEASRLTAEANGTAYHPVGDPAAQVQAAIFAQRAAEYAAKTQGYNEKVDALASALAGDRADAAFYRQRLSIASDVASMREELQREQVGSRLNSLAATDTRIEMARSLASALQKSVADENDLKAMVAERDAYKTDWFSSVSQDLSKAQRTLADQRDQLTKAQLRRNLVVLRADQDAVVQSVAAVSVGSVMQPGQQFFTLVPVNSPLEVQAAIPGNVEGYIRVGDKVSIRFQTFNYAQYGGADGIVRIITPDSSNATQQEQLARTNVGSQVLQQAAGAKSFFEAHITMTALKLRGLPSSYKLSPGMPVQAIISVGKRTVMSYLLGAVMPTFENGMREP